MKKIKIEIDLTNKNLIFDLASIGLMDLFNYPEILQEKDIRGNSVLYYFCRNINTFSDEKQKFLIDYIFSLKNLNDYTDKSGDSLLHVLGLRGRMEILKHSDFNSLKNNFGHTPYYYLIKSVATIKLKDCVIIEELLKPLQERKYVGPIMALDAILDRTNKPTLKQIRDMGIPINCESNQLRKKISYEDISNFKKNTPLMYIFS